MADWAAGALRDLGLSGRGRSARTSTRIRADPAWPGEEMPTAVAAGRHRAGRATRPAGALILSGHLDVVPPGDPATWTVDPWAAEILDGRLYGRGACDMKGGVAAILAAVRSLWRERATSHRLDGELLVVLVPSEEDGGQGTLAAIRAGATGDLAIITEPSRLDVVVAHAGAITFRLTVPGRAAHASQRREGVSALDKLFVLTRALEADEAAPQRRRDRPADDGARAAVPDDHRHRRGRRVGVDRARPGRRRRPLRGAARAVAGRRGGRAAGGDRRRPAPPTSSCATTRRPSRSPAGGSGPRGCRPTIRCRSGWPTSPRRSPAGGRRCSASRTAPTCRCSSTTAGRRA